MREPQLAPIAACSPERELRLAHRKRRLRSPQSI